MKRIAALILLACLTAKARAAGFEPFVVSDIRIDGLTRISGGTVFSYLPVEKGDTITPQRAEDAIRALYKTGFFSDVELERQGDILVIKVQERPSISRLTLHGNKDIKEDDLKKGLKEIGLSEGDTFDRMSLDHVKQELIRQYYNRGKYNVSIEPHVVPLDRNRVAIDIEIHEGQASRIKEINIVGNQTFTDKQIRDDFQSATTNWTSWYSKDDQYSREKLSGDLEKLASYYLDRGYADFQLDSTEVAISPDKRNMYISAGIKEGEVYTISDVKLLGKLILPEDSIRRLVPIKAGDTFSRKKIELSTDAITAMLSNIGYAFAKVSPVPKLDKEKRTVDLTLYVDPGQRVYVRRINFKGNTRTEDEVLRREMRQLEGAWYSQAAINRSKIRLQRLGYFKTVEVENQRVPGSEDQVDLNVKVEEQASGSLMFGIGYSQVSGAIISVSVSENNFLGTGDKVSATVQHSSYYDTTALSYYNPYLTDSGIGIGYSLRYSKLDQSQANLANYTENNVSGSTFLSIPVSETDTINVGLGLSKNRLNVYPGLTPQSFIDYLIALDHYTIHTGNLTASYAHDTRNKYFSPTRGGIYSLSTEIALPGSTVQYYKATALAAHYFPLPKDFVWMLSGQLGYGDTYGRDGKLAFPFWQNFYAGGVNDVRGFRDNTLGPRVLVPSYFEAQPVGGAFKVLATSELYLPLPFLKNTDTARVSWFVDVGNVYASYNAFSSSELRASTGLSLQWQAPVGPIRINLAWPLRDKPEDRPYRERLQFTFGSQF
ncbi:MAG: outer membrane protein assembly factor BamA [Mizugakiibacter sp.]|uniref:outer membrane protein assembly factor BamA n=1 Tax=Mizugakiibacter sp. TaxID=1972610 RepID=UPI0031C6474C|nr:outer membrane protein assembly factor BamA [Xanthomonadaceae bacterium]